VRLSARLTLLTLLLVPLVAAVCDGEYRITSVYCPVSDSAKARADSVPLPCLYPPTDTATTP
jgi:hypothetical protein